MPVSCGEKVASYTFVMPKKGEKIKDLARELGVTSRSVIDRCRAAGISAQNSITRLSPTDARRVRGWFAATAHPSRDNRTSE